MTDERRMLIMLRARCNALEDLVFEMIKELKETEAIRLKEVHPLALLIAPGEADEYESEHERHVRDEFARRLSPHAASWIKDDDTWPDTDWDIRDVVDEREQAIERDIAKFFHTDIGNG